MICSDISACVYLVVSTAADYIFTDWESLFCTALSLSRLRLRNSNFTKYNIYPWAISMSLNILYTKVAYLEFTCVVAQLLRLRFRLLALGSYAWISADVFGILLFRSREK